MEWIVLILWSILTFLAGNSFQKFQNQQQQEALPKQEFSAVIHGEPEVTKAEFESLAQKVTLVDAQLQSLDEDLHNQPAPDISMGAERRLNEIEPLLSRVKELEMRDQTYQDRFRRVERKAGMSV